MIIASRIVFHLKYNELEHFQFVTGLPGEDCSNKNALHIFTNSDNWQFILY